MKTILILTKANIFYTARKLVGFLEEAQRRDCKVVCLNPDETGRPLRTIISAIRPDGIVLEGTDCKPYEIGGIPIVVMDTNFNSPRYRHTVRIDSAATARLAFDELITPGTASALFVSASANCHWSTIREMTFGDLCRNADVPFFSATCAGSDIFSFRKILARRLAKLPRPIAAFTANDIAAEQLYSAAEKAGLKIPDALSVVSVDDNPLICKMLEPQLTSIIQNPYDDGKSAADLIIRLMDNPALPPENILIAPVGIVRRGSSSRPVRNNAPSSERVFAYLREHALDMGLTCENLAAELGLPRRSLERDFLSVNGKSLHQTIMDIRFAEVERLLLKPSQLIDPIANLCGWQSSAHLKRAFLQRYGMTMTKWRALH